MGFRNTVRGVRPGDVTDLAARVDAAQAAADAADAAAALAHEIADAANINAAAAATEAAAADAKATAADADAAAAQADATAAATAAATADAKAVTAQTAATDAQTVATRKARTFYGDTPTPDAEGAGDLWVDPTPDGDELKIATAPGTAAWQLINLIAAAVQAGAIDGHTITGTNVRTDVPPNARVELGNPFGLDEVWWFGGYPGESPARMRELGSTDRWKLLLWGGTHGSGHFPQMVMASESTADPLGTPSEIGWGSDRFVVDLFGSFGAGGDGARGRFVVRDLDDVALPEAFAIDVRAKTVEIGVGYALATRLRAAVDGRVTTVGDPRYSAVGHAHTGVYSPTTHNHDAAYAASGHSHAGPGVWSTYTPTFTAPTTNPTLANFTRAGRYLNDGSRIHYEITITCNTAAGLGSGVYQFGLPPVAARNANEVLGVCMVTGPNMVGAARGINTSEVSVFRGDTSAGMSNANTVLQAGGIIRISGTYEAA